MPTKRETIQTIVNIAKSIAVHPDISGQAKVDLMMGGPIFGQLANLGLSFQIASGSTPDETAAQTILAFQMAAMNAMTDSEFDPELEEPWNYEESEWDSFIDELNPSQKTELGWLLSAGPNDDLYELSYNDGHQKLQSFLTKLWSRR